MNNTEDLENIKDEKSARREQKKKPRMLKRGHALKKRSKRSVLHIHKKTKK